MRYNNTRNIYLGFLTIYYGYLFYNIKTQDDIKQHLKICGYFYD